MSSDLEVELELLKTNLEAKGAELHDIIKDETQRKEAELRVNLDSPFLIFELLIFYSENVLVTLYSI